MVQRVLDFKVPEIVPTHNGWIMGDIAFNQKMVQHGEMFHSYQNFIACTSGINGPNMFGLIQPGQGRNTPSARGGTVVAVRSILPPMRPELVPGMTSPLIHS